MNDLDCTILRHRKTSRKWCILLLLACSMVSACSFSEEKIKERIADIEKDIDLKDYDTARSKLKKYSSMHDDFIYHYNLTAIDIASGNCDQAKTDLEAMLTELEAKEDKPEQNVLVLSQYKQNKLNGHIHLALAKAILCSENPKIKVEPQHYEEALAHLYTASTYGIELDDAILDVIHRWIPSCESFIGEWQIPAEQPDNAMEISALEGQELTICPNGVWLKVKARNHETLSANIELAPIPRQVWLDDSSKLPFAQLQIDVFNHIPDENDFPIAHFSQPLPKSLPSNEAYQSLSYPLNALHFEDDSTHYIHLYTKNNGELKLRFKYDKDANCQFIDDLTTYNAELEQTPAQLNPDAQLNELLLCPNRPDQFSFSLQGQQYALIALNEQPNAPKTDLPFSNPIFQLLDANGKVIPISTEPVSSPSSMKTRIIHFKSSNKAADPENQEQQSEYILINNTADSLERYTLILSLPEQIQSIKYNISLSLSHECTPDNLNRELPLQLESIQQTRRIQYPPAWVCPNDSLTYRPMLPQDMPLLRAKVEHVFISDKHFLLSDIEMASYLSVASNPNQFLVENAQDDTSQWENALFIRNQLLLKPITSDTIFKLKTTPNGYGFSLISVSLNDEDNNPDDSNESKENKENQDKKDQHDETQKQDNPNKSPDKPSETQATAKGAGEDTRGNESTPDEQASGDNAAKLDMQQYERDQIDDLLDTIEKGHYYVPLSGKVEELKSDKDW